jgi:hypothetical protein
VADRLPDELSANARRWYGKHKGPNTPATIAVRAGLDAYYDDGRVLDSIRRLAWGYRPGVPEQLRLDVLT